jgi:hypothetical protein
VTIFNTARAALHYRLFKLRPSAAMTAEASTNRRQSLVT